MGRKKLKSYNFDVILSVPEGSHNGCSDVIDRLTQLEANYGKQYVVSILRQLSVNAVIGHFNNEQSPPVVAFGNHSLGGKPNVQRVPDAGLATTSETQADKTVEGMDISEVKVGGIADMIKF